MKKRPPLFSLLVPLLTFAMSLVALLNPQTSLASSHMPQQANPGTFHYACLSGATVPQASAANYNEVSKYCADQDKNLGSQRLTISSTNIYNTLTIRRTSGDQDGPQWRLPLSLDNLLLLANPHNRDRTGYNSDLFIEEDEEKRIIDPGLPGGFTVMVPSDWDSSAQEIVLRDLITGLNQTHVIYYYRNCEDSYDSYDSDFFLSLLGNLPQDESDLEDDSSLSALDDYLNGTFGIAA